MSLDKKAEKLGWVVTQADPGGEVNPDAEKVSKPWRVSLPNFIARKLDAGDLVFELAGVSEDDLLAKIEAWEADQKAKEVA